jgi:hypothetical protein
MTDSVERMFAIAGELRFVVNRDGLELVERVATTFRYPADADQAETVVSQWIGDEHGLIRVRGASYVVVPVRSRPVDVRGATRLEVTYREGESLMPLGQLSEQDFRDAAGTMRDREAGIAPALNGDSPDVRVIVDGPDQVVVNVDVAAPNVQVDVQEDDRPKRVTVERNPRNGLITAMSVEPA